jgi:ABC-type dipeptide/oligopeptide/nickel transport system ATPase subunit
MWSVFSMVGKNNNLAADPRPLLAARNVTLEYASRRLFGAKRATTVALQDVSVNVFAGKTLALVGPSGCGKSSLARCLLLLEQPSAGQILYRDEILLATNRDALKAVRKEIHLIFQDSASALNPGLTLEEILSEPLVIHKEAARDRQKSIQDAMEQVELPSKWLQRRPLELSGGQRQRVAIARALVLQPKVLILDEALSALDLSTQGQIANLLRSLQAQHGIGYLYITHDLSMAGVMGDEVAVMKSGRIVRQGRVPGVLVEKLQTGAGSLKPDLALAGNLVATVSADR